jgi:hypothetical protein
VAEALGATATAVATGFTPPLVGGAVSENAQILSVIIFYVAGAIAAAVQIRDLTRFERLRAHRGGGPLADVAGGESADNAAWRRVTSSFELGGGVCGALVDLTLSSHAQLSIAAMRALMAVEGGVRELCNAAAGTALTSREEEAQLGGGVGRYVARHHKFCRFVRYRNCAALRGAANDVGDFFEISARVLSDLRGGGGRELLTALRGGVATAVCFVAEELRAALYLDSDEELLSVFKLTL